VVVQNLNHFIIDTKQYSFRLKIIIQRLLTNFTEAYDPFFRVAIWCKQVAIWRNTFYSTLSKFHVHWREMCSYIFFFRKETNNSHLYHKRLIVIYIIKDSVIYIIKDSVIYIIKDTKSNKSSSISVLQSLCAFYFLMCIHFRIHSVNGVSHNELFKSLVFNLFTKQNKNLDFIDSELYGKSKEINSISVFSKCFPNLILARSITMFDACFNVFVKKRSCRSTNHSDHFLLNTKRKIFF